MKEKNRRLFFKDSAILGLGISLNPIKSIYSNQPYDDRQNSSLGETGNPIFNMCGYASKKLDIVRVGIIGLGRGKTHVRTLALIEKVEIKALSDLIPENILISKKILEGTNHNPSIYADNEDAWMKMCERDDIDLIYIATPWELHVPMALYAMDHGKHVAIEVPAATSLEDAWRLVNKSEETKMHCIILENCCYDYFELLTLNMVRRGFFGEIIHCEGAYIHFLMDNITKKNFKWNMWRLKENYKHSGNLYPTHGLGPICQALNINRGDKLNYMVSMSSEDFSLNERIEELSTEDDFYEDYKNESYRGNINTSIIKTQKGKTLMVQHDVSSPRPYSRIHLISGTKGSAQKYPLPGRISNNHGSWLSQNELTELEELYKPKIVEAIGEEAKKIGGHGGMDFLMNWRIIDCLRNGLPMDMDVYDAALWSSIFPLSELGVKNYSMTTEIPDFTRGAWRNNKPVSITLEGGGNTGVRSLKD